MKKIRNKLLKRLISSFMILKIKMTKDPKLRIVQDYLAKVQLQILQKD